MRDYPIELVHGADWKRTFTYLVSSGGAPVNLTGHVFKGLFLPHEDDPDTAAVITLTTGAGLTITPTLGIVVLQITKAQIAALTTLPGWWKWEHTNAPADGSLTTRELTGAVVVVE